VSVIVRKPRVKFAKKEIDSFYDVLKDRINDYFATNNIPQQSNAAMRLKTVVMLSLYFVPFSIIVTGLGAGNVFIFLFLWVLMGLGIVGIGASIMHDSNHGSYTTNKHVNRFLGNLLNILGGYALNWRIQHNVLHHTYTNLNGLDEDIDAGPFLRMTPDKPLKNMHKFQHIYAWGLYCLMNLYWITAKDYVLLFRYHKSGLLSNQKTTLRKALIELTVLKTFYFSYALVLPILYSGMAWYYVVAGFVIMHVIAGFSLAVVFQPAHVVPTSEFPTPNQDLKIENSWAVHQVLNTADFAPNNKLVSWFIGGLNFQIEHHLFPHICHIHYPAIAGIVKKTATEFGIPYVVMPTFIGAIAQHGKMLKELGSNIRPTIQAN